MVSLRKGLQLGAVPSLALVCLHVFVQGLFYFGNRNMAKRPTSLHAAASVFSCFKSSSCGVQRCMKVIETLPTYLEYKDPIYIVTVISRSTASSPARRVWLVLVFPGSGRFGNQAKRVNKCLWKRRFSPRSDKNVLGQRQRTSFL